MIDAFKKSERFECSPEKEKAVSRGWIQDRRDYCWLLEIESLCFPRQIDDYFLTVERAVEMTRSRRREEKRKAWSVGWHPGKKPSAVARLCFIMCCWQWATGTHDLTSLFVGFRLVRWKIYFFSTVLCGPVCTGSETLTASISHGSSWTENGKRTRRLLQKNGKTRSSPC